MLTSRIQCQLTAGLLDHECDIVVIFVVFVLKVGLRVRIAVHAGTVKNRKVPGSLLSMAPCMLLAVGLGALSYFKILKPFSEPQGSSRKCTPFSVSFLSVFLFLLCSRGCNGPLSLLLSQDPSLFAFDVETVT